MIALLLGVKSVVYCTFAPHSPSSDVTTTNETSPYLLSTQYNYTIIIDPTDERAVEDEKCHPPSAGVNSSIPCKSLYYAFHHFRSFNSVMFYLASPTSTYTINVTANFTNIDGIAIYGNGSAYPTVPKIECESEVGFSFVNTKNIVLTTLTFHHCNAKQRSTSVDLNAQTMRLLTIHVGLYFFNCTTVSMSQVKVADGSCATGVVMYDVDGVIQVDRCVFTGNNATDEDDCGAGGGGGGGFSVEFPYCLPGDNGCGNGRRNSNATYHFNNSTFEKNFASGQNVSDYGGRLLCSKLSHQAIGRGGGLSLFFKGNASGNEVNFVKCLFDSNHAVWGGGLLIEMGDSAHGNKVSISDSVLHHNHAFFVGEIGTGGGGLLIRTCMYHVAKMSTEIVSRDDTISAVHIDTSRFTNNHAVQGGALSLILGRQNCCFINITVSNCLFNDSRAQLGTAVSLKVFYAISEGHVPKVVFRNCSFTRNSVKYEKQNKLIHPVGIGSVYVNQVPVAFQERVEFTSNEGSALVVVGSRVDFDGAYALFYNNTALLGAGIALLGTASIVVGGSTVMNFTNNFALQYGGGIYNEYIIREDLSSNTDCFIHYAEPFLRPQNWTTVFIFHNNTADRGNAIFSSSILPCSFGSSQPNEIFCWNDRYWNYGDLNCTEQIHTKPHTFIHENATQLSSPILTYPGLQFRLPLTAFDDLQHNVTNDSVYYAFTRVEDGSSEKAVVETGFKHVSSNLISVAGKLGERGQATLVLQTDSSQIMHVNLNLTMVDCPPGFYPKNGSVDNSFVCLCLGTNSYGNSLKCFSKEQQSYIQVDKWLGPLEDRSHDDKLYMGTITWHYREPTNDSYTPLPLNRNKLNEWLCKNANRNGTLCGECARGYAVAVNSPDYRCVRCDNIPTAQWVGKFFAYIALTYGPILVMFLAIIFLNFKLTSSAAMGFVLYAQMVGSEVFFLSPGALVSNHHFQRFQTAYMAIYGIFNLNSLSFIMNPFCLNKNFGTLDVICLDYVIAGFPLVMIVLIYFAFQCTSRFRCPKRRRSVSFVTESESQNSISADTQTTDQDIESPRNNLVHAFSAFMFLSYTKFCLASMKTMALKELYDSNETYVERRIAMAGHLHFSDHKFLFPYGILAIFVFILAVLLPPCLLLGPIQLVDWLIEKPRFSFLRRVWPSIAIHTILDTFQGFYRPGRRFFGSVFVIFRLVVFISYSFAVNINQHYVIQQIAVIVLICLIAIFRPYSNELHNQVNVLIFLNLGIINLLTIFMYTDSAMHFSAKIYTMQCVLVWLPLIYIICYAVWRRVHKRESYRKIKESVKKKFKLVNIVSPPYDDISSGEKEKLLKDDVSLNGEASDDPDHSMFRRATSKNRYRALARQSSVVTFSEVEPPFQPEVKLKDDLPSRDSGADTGTGRSSGADSNTNPI